ncbi:MAG TPA: mandelate racemase/muconate lactonizing enzyme family protein, partial [Gaiellaceae bacterium]
MKIVDVRTTIVAVPQKREFRSSWRRGYQGSTPQIAVLVELEADTGLVGLGESPAVYAGRPEVTVAMIDAVRDLLIGADPFEHDIVRRRIYAETGMAHLGTQGLSWAISGVDTALWDLVGRAVEQPLHRLWGGAWRTRSPFYGDVPPAGPAQMAEDAVAWVERGFRTLYVKVGFGADLDVARIRAIRQAVGDGPRIRVDANQAWSPAAARTTIERLAELDLEYVEQPTPASNLDEMAALRRMVGVPILAHEASLTVEGTLNTIAKQAADALQLDPRFDAGITGARTAALMAEAAGLPVVTHTFGELGVATAAVLQLHAAHRNFVLDNQTYYWNLEDDVIVGGLMPWHDCELEIPTGPGIGVELDRERVAHFAALYEREVRGRVLPAP